MVLAGACNPVISTVAGTGLGTFNGDHQPATLANLSVSGSMVVDDFGNLFFADPANSRVRRVSAVDGDITTVAGTGVQGYNGDNRPATTAQLNGPVALAKALDGSLIVAEKTGCRIRRIDAATQAITTVAGTGTCGYASDTPGPATGIHLMYPEGVAVGPSGDLYVSNTSHARVHRIDRLSGTMTVVAGSGSGGYNGDGIPATSAWINSARGLAVDASDNIYIADTGNSRVRHVDASTGIITTVAGTSTWGFNGDGQPADQAQLRSTSDVAIDAGGNLFIADEMNQRVRRVDAASGVITTIAGSGDNPSGSGTGGFGGDGGAPGNAALNHPYGLAIDGAGTVYIADSWNRRIRKVTYAAMDTRTPSRLVALGDSYAAGTGSDNLDNGTADTCKRSPEAYPRLLAQNPAVPTRIDHVACHGAKVVDVLSTDQYPGQQAAQLTYLDGSPSVSLVTITVGGNDVLFGPVLDDCWKGQLSCVSHWNSWALTSIANLRPQLRLLYERVDERSGGAAIRVLGYPRLFSTSTSAQCGDQLGINTDERAWLNEMTDLLDDAVAGAVNDARQAGVDDIEFVDVREAFDSHPVCSADPWIIGVSTDDKSFHPNSTGHRATGRNVLESL